MPGWGGDIERRQIASRMLVIGVSAFAAVLLGSLLPDIGLDTAFADVMVRVSDTAYWDQMPFLCVASLLVLSSRRGPTIRRRGLEAATIAAAMLIVLAGNAVLNEYVVKPVIGVPRPSIVALAEDGVLGAEIGDADDFYAVGSKDERRDLLAERLTPARTPGLSERVRDHWIHEAGYALPSGHATAAMTFATLWVGLGFAWLQGWRRIVMTVLIPLWAVAVSSSRVLLEVHRAADVIVGAVVGIIWGLAALVVIRRVVEG